MDAVELEIEPRDRTVGSSTVRRLLPVHRRRMVGPFIFLDRMGPATVAPGTRLDIDAHPHIGLSTLTYLFAGRMVHRDSTGAVATIEPGAVNWMTAGAGVCHTERSLPDDLDAPHDHHGLQLWVALPEAMEATDPGFAHTPASAIPTLEVGGARLRVLVGEVFGVASPVVAASPTLFVDITMAAGDAFPAPPATERALYGVDGPFTLDGQPVPAQTLVVLAPGEEPLVAADGDVRLALVGGEPLGPRFMWWNFVSSHKARIDQAADDWAAGRFPAVPGETEFIPLPSR